MCDRIAILRKGKLVELGTLEEMRHLSALTIEASFDSSPPNLSKIPGVSDVHIAGNQVSLQVRGPIYQVLDIIVKSHPKTLISREPSLEELFLSIYGDNDISKHPDK